MANLDMLRLIVKAAKKARVKMGIGGGVAVAAHGFRRNSDDVDAFFHYKDKQKVLRALRQLAPEYVIEPVNEAHWVAAPDDAYADERIDLMFATGDPEESAIQMAKTKRYKQVPAPMFPVDMLIVTKYLADRDDGKDWLDIYSLYQRGAFTIPEITRRLCQMGLSNEAEEFAEFMQRLLDLKKK